ncbi:unnamed protein product [Aspergillus oryzae var. brunneus]|uniref:Unnamed protein product n=2 Tax=Aspergillus oryzae TaxID=5062 RepID=A0AAN4YLU5_ASPOZ|nr:unnamed protein product [Aspergillus oryzae]GMG28814.1 unnamed protein product [Aspergillus oryzae]GMG44409.1 unnamed protein product [Aspergillus oryzae var. brunneus]
METKFLCPDADHAPTIEQYNCDGNGAEHGFGAEFEALLDEPEAVDPHCLLLIVTVVFNESPKRKYPRVPISNSIGYPMRLEKAKIKSYQQDKASSASVSTPAS